MFGRNKKSKNKGENKFSAAGAGKKIQNRKRNQQAQLDAISESPGEQRRRKLVEEAGGSYNK